MRSERLARIRNWQSSEFYARLVMRPLAILIMLVVGDWRWLTPNAVTTLANVAKLGSAVLIAQGGHPWAAALLLQLGLLLDHLDGSLARYRRAGTAFGAFYDKVSDALTWIVITGAVGLAAYQDTGDVWLPVLALGSAYALLTLGYMKWILAAATRTASAPSPTHAVPERTASDWVKWFFASLARAVMFEEVDLFFWIGLGIVVGRLDLLIYLLAVSQGVQLLIMTVRRGLEAHRLDDRARPHVKAA